MLAGLLTRLGRRGPTCLALGVFLGLVAPGLAKLARPWFPAIIFALLAVIFVRIDLRRVRVVLQRPLVTALTLVALLGLTPLAVAALVSWLDLRPGLAQPAVLYAAAPPLLSAPALAYLLRLDPERTLVLTVGGLALAPVSVPLLLAWLADDAYGIDPLQLAVRLAALVLGAAACGGLARRVLGARLASGGRLSLDGLMVVLMLAFAVAVMDGVPARFVADPGGALTTVAAVFGLNLGLQAVTGVAFLALGRTVAATHGLVGGNRNLGVLLASWAGSIDPELFFFFAMAQLPIYLLPALLRPWYRGVLA